MPPCGVALTVLEAVAEATVFVTTSVTVLVSEAIMAVAVLQQSEY